MDIRDVVEFVANIAEMLPDEQQEDVAKEMVSSFRCYGVISGNEEARVIKTIDSRFCFVHALRKLADELEWASDEEGE